MRHHFAIVDLGGQYCHLISRRFREFGLDAEIVAASVSPSALAKFSGLVLSGGPNSVYESDSPQVDPEVFRLNIPVLGICYGHQLMANALGGRIAPSESEYGSSKLDVTAPSSALFKGLPRTQDVVMSHTDSVVEIPKGFEVLASTPRCANAAFADTQRHLYGVQFHPEVDHTKFGRELLRNFAFDICRARPKKNIVDRSEELQEEIRKKVGESSVFFLVSGGVDSTVAFSLCGMALGRERVLGLYIDTGLMRKDETIELRRNLSFLGLGDRVLIRDESDAFLTALQGKTDPETKRKDIGRVFVEVQAKAMHELGIDEDHWFLGQGTIYPDTIESGGNNGTAGLIKTHHNRCAEIQHLIEKGRVIEPLAEFYKDEVRQIGRSIGLDHRLLDRWPFPGPGLGIRVLCTPAGTNVPGKVVHLSDDLGSREAASFGIYSVGVQGDSRTYREVVALRGELEYDELQAISSELCNVRHQFNRVIYQLGGDFSLPLHSGRVVGRSVSRDRLEVLREADAIARSVLEAESLAGEIWQMPVVLVPVSFGSKESVVLRPVNSENGMTANFARLREKTVRRISDLILATGLVDAVFLDVTDKPPATIEWE